MQVYFASSTSNGLKSISSSSFSIHKIFRVEIEYDFISKETRSLEISIGAGEKSYEEPSDWLNDCDRAIGAIFLAISPCLRYLIDSVDYPKDIWTILDRVLGKDNEDPSSYVESASSSSMIYLSQYVSASIVFDEVDHEDEVSHTVLIATTL